MPIKVPASFTAGRKVTINGTTYQPGAAVPNAVAKTVRNLSSLLARRYLVPNVEQNDRRGQKFKHFGPSSLGITALRKKL